ncbi:MAG: sulfite exporter TauE/SafE family protein [Pseudomonadota bacterium]|nr:sulfite exporter TauE/SafE family protein [Alphaproteobacteria bacterium]MDP5370161.1 sulfite exporter TauE/SafE family protein [Pseudomonadota bacterium]
MMFDILFPIADHVMNPLVILTIGVIGGSVAGMLGIGSGVIVTPLLIMVGIPPMIAVASQLNNSIGTNLIGFMSYWRLRDVDFALAWYLFIGGIIGACGEIFLLEMVATNITAAEKLTIAYLFVLGTLGSMMLYQNIRTLMNPQKTALSITMRHWMIYFPYHRIFTRARVEMSTIIPICVGIATGLLTSTLGGGNSLFMMPIVYYLIGRSSPVVAGTTLLAAFAISIAVTIAHGFSQYPSDWLLALTLLFGSAIGSQLGIKFSYRLARAHLGILGAIVILLICSKFGYDFYYLGAQNPVASEKINLPDVFNSALLTTPDWALWMIKLAHNRPIAYAMFGILGVTIIALIIERFICKFIVIKRSA